MKYFGSKIFTKFFNTIGISHHRIANKLTKLFITERQTRAWPLDDLWVVYLSYVANND